jgi:hypothetical protein
MTRKFIFVTALVAVLLLSGCPAKEEKPTASADPVSVGTTDNSSAPVPSSARMAYVIRHNAGFYELTDVKEMIWKSSIALGERVELVGDMEPEAWFGKPTSKYKVFKVRSSGKEYWMIDWQIAETERLGAVSADTVFIYKSPSFTGVTKTELKKLQIVAILGEEGEFYKIAAYITEAQSWVPNTWGIDAAYLPKNKVTAADSDVKAAILVNVALAVTGKDAEIVKKQKLELLGNALDAYPGNGFSDTVSSMMAELNAAKIEVAYSGSDDEARDVSVVVDSAAIFEDHNTQTSNLLNVTMGDALTVGKAAEVNTETGPVKWLHVLAPLQGWILASAVGE